MTPEKPKSQTPAAMAGVKRVRIELAADQKLGWHFYLALYVHVCQPSVANRVETEEQNPVKRIGVGWSNSFRYQHLYFRECERKHTPGSSAPVTGVCQLVRAAFLRGSVNLWWRLSQVRRTENPSGVFDRALAPSSTWDSFSRVRARALDIPVLPNLPPSSNKFQSTDLKALGLGSRSSGGGLWVLALALDWAGGRAASAALALACSGKNRENRETAAGG